MIILQLLLFSEILQIVDCDTPGKRKCVCCKGEFDIAEIEHGLCSECNVFKEV